MTENVELKQSLTGWKNEVLSGSGEPLSLAEATFILSAGIFAAVLAQSAIRLSAACCLFDPLWAILLVGGGGAAGAAIGTATRGPIGGIGGALLGIVFSVVTVVLFEIAVLWVFLFVFGAYVGY